MPKKLISSLAAVFVLLAANPSLAKPSASSHNPTAIALRAEFEQGGTGGGKGAAPQPAGHKCLIREYTKARHAGLGHDDAYDAACGVCKGTC